MNCKIKVKRCAGDGKREFFEYGDRAAGFMHCTPRIISKRNRYKKLRTRNGILFIKRSPA